MGIIRYTHIQRSLRTSFYFCLSWTSRHTICSFNFENLSQKYCEPLRHIVVTKRWSIIIMVQFAFDAMAHDVHVFDSFYFVLCQFFVLLLRCFVRMVFDCNQRLQSRYGVCCVHFLSLATILWVHLITQKWKAIVCNEILFFYLIFCVLFYLLVFAVYVCAWGFLTQEYV